MRRITGASSNPTKQPDHNAKTSQLFTPPTQFRDERWAPIFINPAGHARWINEAEAQGTRLGPDFAPTWPHPDPNLAQNGSILGVVFF